MTANVGELLANADACCAAGRWNEAEALYQTILAQEPRHAASLHRLGLLAHQTGDHDRAVSLIRKAISLEPGEGSFHSSLGGALLALRSNPEAVAAFERAVALDPGGVTARNNLAFALHISGFAAQAASAYEQALAIAPDNADIRNNFAQVLASQGQFDRAIENFRKVIASPGGGAGGGAEVYANLATALCGKGMYADAVDACANALSIDPRSALALSNLGNALCGLKRFSEGVDAYKKAIAIAPRIAEIRKNLGIALHRMGAWDEARASFDEALRIAPDNRKIGDVAGAYSALSQMQAGLDAYTRFLDTAPAFDWSQAVGDQLNGLGFHSLGLETISKGPGLVRLTVAPPVGVETPVGRRINLDRPSTPNFVGCWTMSNPEICDRLVAFFEENAALQAAGRTGDGVNSAIKRSTDISISPIDLAKPAYEPLRAYVRELELCLQDYGRQWPHLCATLPNVEMGVFNIQRYQEGGHFQLVHSERVGFKYIHRALAWMTYLNDVEAGGETAFPHLGLAIKPERGKTVIWPAEWTHAHCGEPVIAGTKYIVTGWFHFPHPRTPDLRAAVVQ